MTAETSPVCGVVLLREDGAALLQLRDNRPDIQDPGIWVFPGGHVEPGESPEAGARREFLEETRYCCDNLRPLVSFSASSAGYLGDYPIIFFWTRFDGKQGIECCEGQELRFVTRDGIPDLPRREYLTRVWDLALTASSLDRKRGNE